MTDSARPSRATLPGARVAAPLMSSYIRVNVLTRTVGAAMRDTRDC